MIAMTDALYESSLKSLKLRHRGKVRDIYDIDDRHMLIVTTDRLSAFDVVLPEPIPGKGAVLTAMSNFWFARTRGLIPNQAADIPLAQVLKDPAERAQVEGRAIAELMVDAMGPHPKALLYGHVVASLVPRLLESLSVAHGVEVVRAGESSSQHGPGPRSTEPGI